MYKIPILFIIFNRNEIAMRSFQSIRAVRPEKLYIACDGPRTPEEAAVVENVRASVTGAVDWDCEVQTLFQSRNLGCGKGVYTAIEWFFSCEGEGIILEDDCVAAPTFFQYAEEMLARYRYDQRVGMVAGFMPENVKNYHYSYLFSRFKSCWGWATWRRAWQNMDMDMSWRKTPYAASVLANSGFQGRDIAKWKFELKCIDNNYVSAWDWQWYFTLAAQNQLCVYPVVNQITNVGNDANATHTSMSHVEKPTESLSFPLVTPPCLAPYEPFERSFYNSDHNLRAYLTRLIPVPVKNKIKGFLKR